MAAIRSVHAHTSPTPLSFLRTKLAMAVASKKKGGNYKVAELVEEDNATVHGVIIDLSPVKSSRNNPTVKYFNAKITDGIE